MKTTVLSGATNVGLFLAHALELETEAAERYAELADSMEAHNNADVAKLFRDLGGYSSKHRDEVQALARQYGPLPKVAPWEFQWDGNAESPEAASWEGTHYLMRPHHALKLALLSETQGSKYYEAVAAETRDPEVARLAREFAEEEAGHVAIVKSWLERYPLPTEGWDDDPDPPNISD